MLLTDDMGCVRRASRIIRKKRFLPTRDFKKLGAYTSVNFLRL